ncbi:small multi-drug export protein [bacterium]|nr:small multi-drug export protein [bacterium]
MLSDILGTFAISLSPLGESRVGIPYGVLNGLPVFWAFVIGLSANLLVFPVFNFLINRLDQKLWRFHFYRGMSLRMMRRSKRMLGQQIQKYGFWGLMVFVMIPLPVTGAYMGVIGSKVFSIKSKQAFLAISIGVTISASIIAAFSHFAA